MTQLIAIYGVSTAPKSSKTKAIRYVPVWEQGASGTVVQTVTVHPIAKLLASLYMTTCRLHFFSIEDVVTAHPNDILRFLGSTFAKLSVHSQMVNSCFYFEFQNNSTSISWFCHHQTRASHLLHCVCLSKCSGSAYWLTALRRATFAFLLSNFHCADHGTVIFEIFVVSLNITLSDWMLHFKNFTREWRTSHLISTSIRQTENAS